MCAALYKWWEYREDKVIHSAGKNMPTFNSMLPVPGMRAVMGALQSGWDGERRS